MLVPLNLVDVFYVYNSLKIQPLAGGPGDGFAHDKCIAWINGSCGYKNGIWEPKNSSLIATLFESFGYLVSQPPFKKWWWTFWMMINPFPKIMVKLGNQPIKNCGWSSPGYICSGQIIATSPQNVAEEGKSPYFREFQVGERIIICPDLFGWFSFAITFFISRSNANHKPSHRNWPTNPLLYTLLTFTPSNKSTSTS